MLQNTSNKKLEKYKNAPEHYFAHCQLNKVKRLFSDPSVRPSQRCPDLHAFLPLCSQLCCWSPVPSPAGAAQRHHLLCRCQHGVRQLHQPGLCSEKPLLPSGCHGPEHPALRPGSGLHAVPATPAGSPGPMWPSKLHHHLGGTRQIQAPGEHHILLSCW